MLPHLLWSWGVTSDSPTTAACLYVVYEHTRPRNAPMRVWLGDAESITLGRGAIRSVEAQFDHDVRTLELKIPDARMSSRHARLMRVRGRWILEDLGSKNGTFVGEQPAEHTPLEARTLIQVGHTWLMFDPRAVVPAGHPLASVHEAALDDPFATLVPHLEHEMATAREAAARDVPVLIVGPSGPATRKIARAIHRHNTGAGPVFLDEVGDLSPEAQADLVGAGVTVRLPPLGERTEDLGLLVARILGDHALTPEAALALFTHPWPGNARELEDALYTALILAADSPIDVTHLPDIDGDEESEHPHRDELVRLLTLHRGNVGAAARAMGKARMQMQRWMKHYALESDQFRR